MKERGNILASIRKSEIEQLAQIRVRSQSGATRHNEVGRSNAMQPDAGDRHPARQTTPAATSMTHETQPNLPNLDSSFDDWLMDVSFSETQMMELANSLNPQDLVF